MSGNILLTAGKGTRNFYVWCLPDLEFIPHLL